MKDSQDRRAPASSIRNWTLETDDQDIAWLGIRTEGSTNVLSERVLQELDVVIEALYTAPPAGLIIFSHKDNGFIAGADIKEFPHLASAAEAEARILTGQAILQRLEDLPVPSVAVLNGMALGGGLELALACRTRLGVASTRRNIGLPEVQLGVHPGLGGTVRAPRLVGVRKAMELMLGGKPVTPEQALRMGLIDKLCEPANWRPAATELLNESPSRRSPPLADRLLRSGLMRPMLAAFLRRQVARRVNTKHYPAPIAIIDLWQRYGATDTSYGAEAASFAKLAFTETSQNLVRIFLLQDRLKSMAKAAKAGVAHVHVVGAGTMGADIAAWCALKGMSVTLQDREKHFVEAGLARARASLHRKLREDALVAEAAARLVGDHTGEGARNADLIVEAIFENKDAKQALFTSLEQRARPDALLATNTSSIPLEQIAAGMRRPARLVGLHFFNPVARMPLVEVVQSTVTDSQVVEQAIAFVKQIGKLPLPCKATPGFLVNRILAPYMDEAFRLVEEGAQPEAVDKVATNFGMPVGPLELADSVGLDILLHVGEIVGPTIGRELPAGIGKMVAAGQLGEKSGQGFYLWKDGKAFKGKIRKHNNTDMQERLILSLVNEAAACVGNGVVTDADLADAGTIFGTGFAPFRGGPLAYARTRGIPDITAALRELEKQHGTRFSPSGAWTALQTIDQKPQS